ncbi:MAG: methyltransferase FkbM family protein [Gemmatimonadetes bacterium]|jgi:FkbM family methyltransferase|nr:methyltransferase FkbM family protein [Gemmatimonadota bacterium]
MSSNSISRLGRSIGRNLARLLPRLPYPVLRGQMKGARFVHGSLAGTGGGASVFLGLVEPEQTAELLRHLVRGMTVFDVGANAGYYTVLAGRAVGPTGQVVAIEPLTSNVVRLARNVEINRLDNVSIVTAAVSDQFGVKNFAIGNNHALGHLTDIDRVDLAQSVPSSAVLALVPAITIDALVARVGRGPDVIKIDVEGAEMEVLRGAADTLSRGHCTIFLSVHSDALRMSCRVALEAYDYSMLPINGDSDHADEYRCEPRSARP